MAVPVAASAASQKCQIVAISTSWLIFLDAGQEVFVESNIHL